MSSERILTLVLADGGRAVPKEIEHERSVALADLLHENKFSLIETPCGPYDVTLKKEENRIVFDITGEHCTETRRVAVPMQGLKRIIRDYFLICESYYAALQENTPHRLEAIDMGRRGMHNEGATELQEMLEGRIALDFCTARRLFTLICVLQMK